MTMLLLLLLFLLQLLLSSGLLTLSHAQDTQEIDAKPQYAE